MKESDEIIRETLEVLNEHFAINLNPDVLPSLMRGTCMSTRLYKQQLREEQRLVKRYYELLIKTGVPTEEIMQAAQGTKEVT